MRIIIVDESKARLQATRHRIASAMPAVAVTEHDLDQQGEPGPAFDWSLYDLLVLVHADGAGSGGLVWLERRQPALGLPPVLVVSDGDAVAEAARRLGAADVVAPSAITAAALAAAAARGRGVPPDAASETTASEVLAGDSGLIESLAGTPEPAEIAYRFVRLIGQGAASRVYLAERVRDRSTLVLKLVDLGAHPSGHTVQRFLREAEIIATADTPYVVRFFDHGATRTYAYIAMEFFTRGDLKQRIEHGVRTADAVNYMLHIAAALDAIHRLGIVHRDVKPANIMFRADDSLALADFGIARRLALESDLTRSGSVLGTPNYLSPEQALGRTVDARADLYGAGVVFYELLTGRKPYRAATTPALVQQHVSAPIPRLPPLHSRFQPILDRLLAKDPAERFANAAALHEALLALGAEHDGPSPPP